MKVGEQKTWTDEASGLECMIVRRSGYNRNFMCGYVAVPSGHPAYGCEYSDYYDIDVHGGLTFSGGRDGKWWFGFDCAHLDDTEDMRGPDYAERECVKLARQLKELAS